MTLLKNIIQAWSWTGIQPSEVVGENEFGNLIVRDVEGCYWRICPEELYCRIVAKDRTQLDSLSISEDFLLDWYMTAIVEEAGVRLGTLKEGRKYCLKTPSVLGGAYSGENYGTISLEDLILTSGYIANQIANLPDGAKVQFKIVD
jgi:hypothetical protein